MWMLGWNPCSEEEPSPLYSLSYPETHSVDKPGLQLTRDPPASVPWVLELNMCASTSGFLDILLHIVLRKNHYFVSETSFPLDFLNVYRHTCIVLF